MSTERTGTRRVGIAGASGARRAFTLVELMVVMGIIAILVSLVFVALHHVRGTGDTIAEQGEVSAFKTAILQFEKDFGAPPPLVVDNPPGPAGAPAIPIYNVNATTVGIAVWSTGDLQTPNMSSTLNTNWPTIGTMDPSLGANRCSEYSLAYYLVGALDRAADGVDGPGFTAVNRDGTFSRRGRVYQPYIDPSLHKTRTGLLRLSVPPAATGNALAKAVSVIRDRWDDGTAPTPTNAATHHIRYYRWLPSYYPQSDPKAGQVQYWNVPIAVGGYFDLAAGAVNTQPPLKSELKAATWAVASAGPDGLFGDEPGLTNAQRIKAISDNIVEVGQ